jgi:hypothetical protein
MPEDMSWSLSPAMLLLKAVADTDTDTFLQERNGIYLIDNSIEKKSAEAIFEGLRHVARPAVFSQADAILRSRKNVRLDGDEVWFYLILQISYVIYEW